MPEEKAEQQAKNAGPPLPWIDKSGPGAQRVAALLLALGQEVAAEIFGKLGELEVRQVALGARDLKKASPSAINDSLQSFVDSMQQAGVDALAGDEVLRKLATSVFGPDAVKRTFDAEPPSQLPEELLGPVASADTESLAMVLQRDRLELADARARGPGDGSTPAHAPATGRSAHGDGRRRGARGAA